MSEDKRNPTLVNQPRRRLLQVVGAAGAASALGMPSVAFGQASTRTVKIGMIQPMTGMFAYNGAQGMVGAKMAADEINAAGGIRSMGGAKLEAAKKAGDKGTPEQKAIVAANQLGDRATLKIDSYIPLTMAAIYLAMLLYFKGIGGYRAVKLEEQT